jgi:site-specific recombinase XerD
MTDSLAISSSLVRQPARAISGRLDPNVITESSQRSVSEETRRAYRRVVREFFRFVGNCHPADIPLADVQLWRDQLITDKKSASTVAFKLSVIRSLFDYLKIAGIVPSNPALAKLVHLPKLPEELRGRALTAKEVGYVLAGPDRSRPEGARYYALLLLMLRISLRVAEACSLKASSIRWSHGRWTLKVKVKGGRERTIPLPQKVKQAIDEYLKLDRSRRSMLGSSRAEAYLFQPHTNYRTLVFNKPISTTMVWYIVRRWGEYGGVGKLSPHDLRRTAITRALD